jgi:valyl-tRNA synthetase
LVENHQDIIKRLVNASNIVFADAVPKDFVVASVSFGEIAVNVRGAVDVEAERKKAAKELEELVTYIQSTEQKLANQEFTAKAPAKVVEGMRQKLKEAEEKKRTIEGRVKG